MATLDITPEAQPQRGSTVTATRIVSDVSLDGGRYRIVYKTNKQEGSWYFDLYDANGAPLVLGLGLVAGVDLLWPYRYRDVPPGVLFCSPHGSGAFVDPGLDAFVQGTHSMIYIEAGG